MTTPGTPEAAQLFISPSFPSSRLPVDFSETLQRAPRPEVPCGSGNAGPAHIPRFSLPAARAAQAEAFLYTLR
jgi:hypothetical protein